MCYVLYLAADRPCPVIAWNEQAPGFHVADLDANEDPVRAQFTKPYVYYVGAHTHCGCGFRWSDGQYDPADEEVATAESMRRLSDYLSALAHAGGVELYACWAGDERVAPESRSSRTAAELDRPGFCLRERQFLTLVAVD